jgi:uncharacterized membrane protein
MKLKYFGLVLLLLLVSFNCGMSGYYYPALPARMASEFDIAGNPTKEMAKSTVMIFNVCMIFLLPAILLTLGRICTKLPRWMLDMPNKDYWLAPERAEQTAESMFRFILWLTNGVVLLLTAIVWLVYQANLGRPEVMRLMIPILLEGFLPFIAVWTVCYFVRFRKKPLA